MRPTSNSSLGNLRFFISLANWFGLLGSLISLIIIFYFSFESKKTVLEQMSREDWVLISSISTLVLVISMYYCAFIINFTRRSDDATILNNRWILALFSLSIGGIWTPFILSRLPNSNVQATITPKFTISKGYGGSALIAATAAIGFYFIVASQFDIITTMNNSQIIWILGAILVWGALNCLLFWTPNAKAAWENKRGMYALMNFVSVINLIGATVILLIQVLISVISIMSIIADMFNSRRGVLGNVLNSMFAAIRIAFYLFIIYTIFQTIKGIWAKQGEFQYGIYSNLAEKQRQRQVA